MFKIGPLERTFNIMDDFQNMINPAVYVKKLEKHLKINISLAMTQLKKSLVLHKSSIFDISQEQLSVVSYDAYLLLFYRPRLVFVVNC